MKREKQNLKWRSLLGSMISGLLILALFTPVFASGEGGDLPPDPGVGTEQNETKSGTTQWVLPYGFTYFIDDEDGNIELDWGQIDLENTAGPVGGIIPMTGLGGENDAGICGAGAGFGGCQTQNNPGGGSLFFPEDLTPEMLNFPPDTGGVGYHNDCSKTSNNCQKEEGNDVKNGGTFWPTNLPDVVVIKAGPNEFFYIQHQMACDPASMAYCVTWNGDGSITVVRIGSGPNRKEISNIQFWHTDHDLTPQPDTSGNCPGVWVSPGIITVSAEQIAPNAAVVIGQDPGEEGVTLEWHVRLNPTMITYQKWEVQEYIITGCVENDPNGNQNRYGHGHDEDWPNGGYQHRYGCGHHNCGCPDNWHPVAQEVYSCQDYYKTYTEGMGELSPGASLQLDSRAWIEGELAAAYPGAHLINPDWSFGTPPDCIWDGDVCTMDFSLSIPVTDPGWYDIRLEGQTAGTQVSPPRSFEVVAGEFGVYLMDSSAIAQ